MRRNVKALLKALGPEYQNNLDLKTLRHLLSWTERLPAGEFNLMMRKLSNAPTYSALRAHVQQARRIAGLGDAQARANIQSDLSVLSQSAALKYSQRAGRDWTISEKKDMLRNWVATSVFDSFSGRFPLTDECVDRALGLNEREVQRAFSNPEFTPDNYHREESLLDHPPAHLYTPYRVLKKVIKKLPASISTVVDLGSGLARLGIYLGVQNPRVRSINVELVSERHRQAEISAKTLGLKNTYFTNANLAQENSLPPGDCYFVFNAFTRRTLMTVFNQLWKRSQSQQISLVMIRVGHPLKLIKRQPWLKLIYESPRDPFWEGDGFNIYRS
jgi:hypothetical protein